MYAKLRGAYARLRTWPVAGAVASRAVWATKGALGRPVSLPPGSSLQVRPPRRVSPPPPADTRLLVALAAVQGLKERLEALEGARAAPPPEQVAGAGSGRPGSVSVIVSTLDRAAWLDRALAALSYQRHGDFEVIVVAGPSTDATEDVLDRHRSRVRVVRCPAANLSASRNLGLRAASGEIVAFLDDDAVPEPDWLQRLCAPFADAQVGGVGGVIRDHTGVNFQCRTVAADRFGRSAEIGQPRHPRLDPPGPEVERYLSLTGTNSSFRRDALLHIGGFDEVYSYFLDETDVCLRLVEAGWRLEVVLEAEVHHAYAPSAQRREDRAPLSLVAPARSTAYFAIRNAAPRHGTPAVAEHLQAYADELRRDIAWRRDQGVTDAAQTAQLEAEVQAGLAEGVRAALAGPRRLLAVSGPADVAPRPARSARPPALERLKLCLLSQQYPRDEGSGSPAGGVGVWTQALAETLSARGHEISVVARGPNASVAFEARDGAGVWVHRIGPQVASVRTSGLLEDTPASVAGAAMAAAAEVARVAPRRQFDFVMGPLWDLEPAALVGSHWPTAVSLHTACAQMTAFRPDWSDSYRRTHVDRVIAGERRLLQAATHLLSNSRAAARDIGAALALPDLADRAMVVPHGLPDLAAGVRPAHRPSEGVEILFVGRMERRKGVDVLLAAAPALFALTPDACLTLVGEDTTAPGGLGVKDGFLAAHAGAPWLSRVRFEGPLARADLLARYAAADVVVVPSRYESFGLTALEAMIFAKPCVASQVGGLCEVVQDGETGRLIPPEDPAALASALLTLVRSEQLRRRMGASGRRLYDVRFTAAAMATAYEAWVRDIVGRTRRLAAE
jgi:glycogen synthase